MDGGIKGDAPSLRESPERKCRTCRYWDAHSQAMKMGDCRAPGDHRYSRVPITSRRPDGSLRQSYALLDSFGREETLPGFVCGAWDDGRRRERAEAARAFLAALSQGLCRLATSRKDGSSQQNPEPKTHD